MTHRRYFALALFAAFCMCKALLGGAPAWIAAFCAFFAGFAFAAAVFCLAARNELQRQKLAAHIRGSRSTGS